MKTSKLLKKNLLIFDITVSKYNLTFKVYASYENIKISDIKPIKIIQKFS